MTQGTISQLWKKAQQCKDIKEAKASASADSPECTLKKQLKNLWRKMMQALKTPLTTAWPDLTWSTLTGGKHCARLPCSNHKLQELWTVWLRLSRDWNQAYKAKKLIQESLTSITTTQNQLLLSCCLHGQHCPKFTCAVLGMLLIPANYNLRQAFWQVGNTPKSHTQWLHKMGFKKCVHNDVQSPNWMWKVKLFEFISCANSQNCNKCSSHPQTQIRPDCFYDQESMFPCTHTMLMQRLPPFSWNFNFVSISIVRIWRTEHFGIKKNPLTLCCAMNQSAQVTDYWVHIPCPQ